MTYRVSWNIDIDDAVSPLDAARKAHAIARRPGTFANVYNVEAPDGVVTIVDLEEVGGLPTENHPSALHQVLAAAERFIAGFEGDAQQEGVDQLLAEMRAALCGRTDCQIVDEANTLARYIMAELIGTGYRMPAGWKFYKESDPRSRKAWEHAVAIMEMITFTNAEDALSNLNPDEGYPKSRLPIENWQREVVSGDTLLGFQAWVEQKASIEPHPSGYFQGEFPCPAFTTPTTSPVASTMPRR